jgi:hypothetical protein
MTTLHRPRPTLSSLLRATAIRSINVKEQGEEKEERRKRGKEERLEKLMNENRTEKFFKFDGEKKKKKEGNKIKMQNE